jgi:hypothetical protein
MSDQSSCLHSGIPCDARRLDGRHHPSCDSGAAQDADHENSCAHYDGRGPDHQQFGPPQANKTGSFSTETIIAAPLAVARLSNTTRSMVIFTTLLPTGVCCPENAVSRLFGGASSWGVSLSAVCGGPTTDDPILPCDDVVPYWRGACWPSSFDICTRSTSWSSTEDLRGMPLADRKKGLAGGASASSSVTTLTRMASPSSGRPAAWGWRALSRSG